MGVLLQVTFLFAFYKLLTVFYYILNNPALLLTAGCCVGRDIFMSIQLFFLFCFVFFHDFQFKILNVNMCLDNYTFAFINF